MRIVVGPAHFKSQTKQLIAVLSFDLKRQAKNCNRPQSYLHEKNHLWTALAMVKL